MTELGWFLLGFLLGTYLTLLVYFLVKALEQGE